MIAQIKIRRGTTAEWAAASPIVLAAGEPGWDTTLKGIKVGDGATEWAELPWIDSKNNPTVNRRNLLDNAGFRNPVNQRGVSGAISSGSYFYDRWIRYNGTVTVNAGYLTLASGAVIEQRIEGLYLAGATVTVSVKVGSNIYSGTGVFPTAAGTAAVTLTGFGTATLGYNAGYMFVRFTASGIQNVEVVKCELGTVSTLHLDPPMDYGAELAKCQRYFIRLKSGHPYGLYSVGAAINALQTFYQIPLPCPMRVLPSIVVSGTLRQVNPTVYSMSGSILHLLSTGSYVQDKVYILCNQDDANAYIDLSSDL